MRSNGSETRYEPTGLVVLMEHQDRSKRWLAARIGVSPQHLSNLLAGRYRFTAEQATRAAQAFDAPVEMLFSPADNAA